MTELADYDLLQLHRLFLGRDPGSDAELAQRRDRTLLSVVREFAGSQEFRLQLQAPIRENRLPQTPAWRFPAGPVAGWAATSLPMDDGARRRLSEARTWPDLFARLFADAEFRRELEGDNPRAGAPAFADACAALATALEGRALAGAVDVFGRDEVRGWALELDRPDTRLELELRCDGRPAARTSTRLFRRELQEVLGGAGRIGFTFEPAEDGLPPFPSGARLEVRDARSGVILGAAALDLAPEVGPIERFRDDVARARAALGWLERRAQELGAAATFPLAEYAGWARAYGTETFRAERRRAEAARALDGVETITVLVSPAEDLLHHAPLLHALERQEAPGWEAVFAERPARVAALEAQLAQLDPPTRGRCRVAELSPGETLEAALAHAQGDYVLPLEGGDTIAPDAVFRLLQALARAPAPQLLYGDDDRFERGDDREADEPLRSAPRLRGAFDLDLLLQEDATGSVVCVRRRELERALAAGGALAPGRRGDLVLRLVEEVGAERVRHLPGVLASLRRDGAGERTGAGSRLEAVRAHLVRTGSLARAEPLVDLLGAPAAGAVRVLHPLPAEPSAAVIIPTRDGLELLRPCLESLERNRAANRTRMTVTVVDNGSVQPATLDYLAAGEREGRLRVVRSDAPFNFAALNNLGARGAEGDALVLLNNDMEVLTPDWLDALVRHASRPEVGAVGARLVYEDLTLQHAGVVTGGAHELTAHEGVGVPASDGGYMGRHARTRRVSAVTGACLATRREVWTRLGGLDAVRFAVDGNDVDYCLRVQEAGWAVIYTPDCTLFHHESKSRGFNIKSETARRRGEEEVERLRARWAERLRRDPWYNPLFDRSAKPFTRLGPPPGPGPDNGPNTRPDAEPSRGPAAGL